MIAQSLAVNCEAASPVATAIDGGSSRAMRVGVYCAQAAVAVALIPALAVVLIVGGVGAAFLGLTRVFQPRVNPRAEDVPVEP